MKWLMLSLLILIGCEFPGQRKPTVLPLSDIDTIKIREYNAYTGEQINGKCFYYSRNSLKQLIGKIERDSASFDSLTTASVFKPFKFKGRTIHNSKIIKLNNGMYLVFVRFGYRVWARNNRGKGIYTSVSLLNADYKPVSAGISTYTTNEIDVYQEYADIWGDELQLKNNGVRIFVDTFLWQ